MTLLNDFKAFILRGNVVDLSVAVVVGAAFKSIVDAFFIVTPVNALMARAWKEPPADPSEKKCPECLSEIPLEARRCAFCTTQLVGA